MSEILIQWQFLNWDACIGSYAIVAVLVDKRNAAFETILESLALAHLGSRRFHLRGLRRQQLLVGRRDATGWAVITYTTPRINVAVLARFVFARDQNLRLLNRLLLSFCELTERRRW